MSLHTLPTPVCNVSPARRGTLTATATSGNRGTEYGAYFAYQNYSYVATPAPGYKLAYIEIVVDHVMVLFDTTTRDTYTSTRDESFETTATDDDVGGPYAPYPWAIFVDTPGLHLEEYIESLTLTAYFVPRTDQGPLVYSEKQGGALVYSEKQGGALVYMGDFTAS